MKKLTLAALGPSGEHITRRAQEAITGADKLFIQTTNHPAAKWIIEQGIPFTSMDDLYESAQDFDALGAAIVDRLFGAEGDLVYAVPGALRGGAWLELLKKRARGASAKLEFINGVGYAEAAMAACNMPGEGDVRIISAVAAAQTQIDINVSLAIEELDNLLLASDVKVALLEYYPAEWPVFLCTPSKDGEYAAKKLPLYELDMRAAGAFCCAACLILPPVPFDRLERYGFNEVVAIMRRLRSKDGCPWDNEQTHESIKKSLIEECYEVLDAIDAQDDAALAEELGDVLLQVVFHARIAQQQSRFSLRDITTGLAKKLIYRHPHIFATTMANTSQEVLRNWDQLKKAEKGHENQTDVLEAVPGNLPALLRAQKVQKKAADVGFDWPHAASALEKVSEETREVACELDSAGQPLAEELGDLLFAVVNVVRLCGLDAEEELCAATKKFIRRFGEMERRALAQGTKLENLPLESQNDLWEEVKQKKNN